MTQYYLKSWRSDRATLINFLFHNQLIPLLLIFSHAVQSIAFKPSLAPLYFLILSYEETFISGALLHYLSKHPVSSQFPDFCKKTENGEKWGKGRKPSSKRKRNCKSYFRNVIVTLNSAWNGSYLQMYTARISSKRFFLCFLPAEFPRLTWIIVSFMKITDLKSLHIKFWKSWETYTI